MIYLVFDYRMLRKHIFKSYLEESKKVVLTAYFIKSIRGIEKKKESYKSNRCPLQVSLSSYQAIVNRQKMIHVSHLISTRDSNTSPIDYGPCVDIGRGLMQGVIQILTCVVVFIFHRKAVMINVNQAFSQNFKLA